MDFHALLCQSYRDCWHLENEFASVEYELLDHVFFKFSRHI